MSDAELRYAVVLQEPAPKTAALAQAMAAIKKQPLHDLMAPMRRAWGLLELDLDEAAARALAAALGERGVAALPLPASLVEELPPAEPARALEEKPPAPLLLAAAVFRATTTRRVKEEQGPGVGERALKLGLSLATGLPLGLMGGGGKRTVEKSLQTSELVYYLDIYAGAPLRRRRIDFQDFDYSCLGQRKGYDAPGNFRRLLEKLSPSAKRLNAGARGLLDGAPVREFGYDGLEDLDREARWLLTLEALKPR